MLMTLDKWYAETASKYDLFCTQQAFSMHGVPSIKLYRKTMFLFPIEHEDQTFCIIPDYDSGKLWSNWMGTNQFVTGSEPGTTSNGCGLSVTHEK